MNKTNQKKTKKKLERMLSWNIRQGAMLYMDGELAPPSYVSSMLAAEQGNYMADYVTDDAGCIKEIHYDRIGK